MNCSRRSSQKSDHEWIALITLYKRVMRANSNMSYSLVICSVALKKRVICQKYVIFTMFLTVFHCFSLFLCPRVTGAIRSHRSLAHKKRGICSQNQRAIFNPAVGEQGQSGYTWLVSHNPSILKFFKKSIMFEIFLSWIKWESAIHKLLTLFFLYLNLFNYFCWLRSKFWRQILAIFKYFF